MIWFVLGMAIAFGTLQKYFSRILGVAFAVVFLVVSLWSYRVDNAWLSFAMGLIACTAVFMMVADCKEIKALSWFSKYTMPIFLMHTLFAAPCRILLIRLGITNAAVHVCAGIVISFAGPIAAMIILEKIKLDFLVYPGKLIKKGSKSGKRAV